MKRQFNPQLIERSLRHTMGGKNQHVKTDLGLTSKRRNVLGINRGSHIANAPLSEYKPDLVTRGRLPVYARSGNDDDQHLQPGDHHQWGLMGDLTPDETAQKNMTSAATGVAVGAMSVLALAWLLGGVR